MSSSRGTSESVEEGREKPQRQRQSLSNGLVDGWDGERSEREGFTVVHCDAYCCAFQIEDMEISLPNIHYFNIDMSKMGLINKDEVREF